MESNAFTEVSYNSLEPFVRSPLFTGVDSKCRAVRCMPVACAKFGYLPDFDLLVYWLQHINLRLRAQHFQALLPHYRPVHPMLLDCSPLRDQQIHLERQRFDEWRRQVQEEERRSNSNFNPVDGWVMVTTERECRSNGLVFAEFMWVL